MKCVPEITIIDKIIYYIKLKIPEYTYNQEDFSVYLENDGLVIRPWNLDVEIPSIEYIEKMTIEKNIEKKCECQKCFNEYVLKRLKEIQDELDTFV